MQCAHGTGLHLTVYSLCTLHIISQTAHPSVGVWAIGVQHLNVQVAPELAGACQPRQAHWEHLSRHRLAHAASSAGLSDSSDYEHKSSTCQELLLPGLCNVPAFIWRCSEPGTAPNVLRPCKCYPGISLALMRGLSWWQWLLETMKIFRVQEWTLNVGYSSARLSFHFFSFNPK